MSGEANTGNKEQKGSSSQMKFDRNELIRTAGYLGAAMLVSGLLRYSIQGVFQLFSEILLIAGGVLVLIAIIFNFRLIIAFFTRRSSKLGTNAAVITLAVLAILGLVNFLGERHHKRFDLTTEKLFTLSDQTRNIVKGVKQDVKILRFDKQKDQDAADRVAEYASVNRHISFQNVDPQEHPEMAKEYGVARVGQVIVASGNRKERLEGTSEEDFTSAILKATSEKVNTVCFIEGHGEKTLTDAGQSGYKNVADELKRENYATKTVNLVSENGVPSDCTVLVDAGPAKALFPQEAEMIGKYLENGGKALLLIDPDTNPGLADVLKAWDIGLGDNTVIDASGVGRMFGTGPAVPLVSEYGPHPITQNFGRTMSFFPLARTVTIAEKGNTKLFPVELLKTSSFSFAVKDLEDLKKRGGKLDPKVDTQGPLSIGVAVENKQGDKDTRLVVIGDSDFASNQVVSMQRNGDLFYNAINWLSADENLISIRPKSPTNRRVNLTEGETRGLFWFSLVLLPGFVILAGIIIWWKRR